MTYEDELLARPAVERISIKSERAAKVANPDSFKRQAIGAVALSGILGVWLLASWFESGK